MKKSLFPFFLLALCATDAFSQADSTAFPELDKSPMDMSYWPVNYPILKVSEKTNLPPVIRVIYGRPQKNGRAIFGDLIEYGKVWRLGANEATEIEFYNDVTIEGKKIKKGRYTLYAIPEKSNWTLIINKATDTWGAFAYNAANDVARITAAEKTLAEPVESLSIAFAKNNTGIDLVIAWDTTEVQLPILLK